jgi:hypothetical protein
MNRVDLVLAPDRPVNAPPSSVHRTARAGGRAAGRYIEASLVVGRPAATVCDTAAEGPVHATRETVYYWWPGGVLTFCQT